MRSESGRRTIGVAALAAGLLTMGPVACRDEGKAAGASATSAAASPRAVPASEDVIALLDGLKVGDSVAGYEVTWIGAVREDGAASIRLEQGGRRMRLALALDTDNPRPPVRTEKYALYYEDTKRVDTAGEQDCTQVLEALAKRIRKVEGQRPTPAGMRTLPSPAAKM